ncbi:hypothetical protein L4D13_27020 [Photobacterium profundum]|uniref:hypothetical protein n=1 Tax=Photobacterium profundum TaxID=74109 RepID=UPI003D1355E2
MNISYKLQITAQRLLSFVSILVALFSFFRNEVKIQVVKITIFTFISKYINMVVMFIPIKLLFLLSGAKNISFLTDIEESIGRELYIGILVCIVIVLYILDMFMKIYKGKLTNFQKEIVNKDSYLLDGKPIQKKIITRTYNPYCQVLSDVLLIVTSIGVFLVVSPTYALYFVTVILLYVAFIEYLVFSPHQTRLLKKLSLDNNQFIHVCNGILYLIFFIGIVIVLLTQSIHILLAIFMMLVSRITNTSLRTVFTSQRVLRRDYFS